MFEKTGRLAEKLATGLSRRDFLGSLGRWAGATALAVAGVVTTSGSAQAGLHGGTVYCCPGNHRCGFCSPPSPGCTIAFQCVGGCGPGLPTPQCIWNCNGSLVYTNCFST